MNFKTAFVLAASAMGILGSGSAKAADLYPAPPRPFSAPGAGSCLYLRMDAMLALPAVPKVSSTAGTPFIPVNNQAAGESITRYGGLEGGVGCQITDIMRIEAVVGYRSSAKVTDTSGSLDMDFTSFTGFANAYWDITNYAGFTPYVGAGVGIARHNIKTVTSPVTGLPSNTNSLAWNIMLGVSYDITPRMKLDLGYRYSHLGPMKSAGTTPILLDGYKVHDVKLGIRYHFN